jgi:hypothetical protein
MKNFAYGSNMCRDRLLDRVPSARYEFVVSLSGHALRFHKRSIDDSAKADAFFTEEEDHKVWGIVVDVPEDDRGKLDRAEGLGQGYTSQDVTVLDCDGNPYQVVAYLAEESHIDSHLRPYDWYLALVVDGARARGLPDPYVKDVEAVPAVPDPEPDRPSRPPENRVC